MTHFVFYPFADSPGHDLEHCEGPRDLAVLEARCLEIGGLAFNSSGWIKAGVRLKQEWTRDFSSANEGLYVRSDVFELEEFEHRPFVDPAIELDGARAPVERIALMQRCHDEELWGFSTDGRVAATAPTGAAAWIRSASHELGFYLRKPHFAARFGRPGLAPQFPEGPSSLADARAPTQAAMRCPIPPILHQIWIGHGGGTQPMPLACRIYADRMRRIHEAEGWRVHLWGDELYDIYADDPFVHSYRERRVPPAYIADRFRLLLLRDIGGLYCDVDAVAVRSFTTLLDSLSERVRFVAGLHDPKVFAGLAEPSVADVGVLASAPHSRVVRGVLDLYDDLRWAHGGRPIGYRICQLAGPDTVLLGYPYFYSETIRAQTLVLTTPVNLGTWRNA